MRRQAAPIAGPVLRAADAAVIGALHAAGARLVDADRLDDRSDEVWAAAADHYPVLARRDLSTLAWRIDQRPDAVLLHRHYLSCRGRAVGYAALRAAERLPRHGGGRRLPGSAPLGGTAAGRRRAGRHGPRRGGHVGQDPQRARRPVPAVAGFVRRDRGADAPIRFMVHAADEDPEVNALVSDPDTWFVTSADSDLEYAMSPGTDAGAAPGSAESTASHVP